MKTSLIAISAIILPLMLLPAEAQPKGSLIGSSIATNSTAVNSSPISQSDTNAGPVIHADAEGCFLPDFNDLAGYSLPLTDELQSNTNRPAWADTQVNAMIPASIRALDGKQVIIEGFILPVTFDASGKIATFLLMKNQVSCCYGGTSQLHEFITVKLNTPEADPGIVDTVAVKGILHVGAERQNGELSGVYRLDAGKIGK